VPPGLMVQKGAALVPGPKSLHEGLFWSTHQVTAASAGAAKRVAAATPPRRATNLRRIHRDLVLIMLSPFGRCLAAILEWTNSI